MTPIMPTEGLMCWSCGKPTGITGKVFRNDTCPHCNADMRCCRGCRHFDPTRRFQCRETIESNIVEKEKSNFCDVYQFREVIKKAGGVSTQGPETKDNRKKKFDDLFND
ncbi:MAG: hypothetical protein IPH75_08315 [bacterium]|nr:hypothetical protein [bacterium]